MQIPSWPQAGERELELLRQVLESPQWGGFHPFVEKFERSFAAYQQADFGVSAFNGTVTLEALLTVLGIGPGDEVIVPAISFVATAMAVSRCGAVPVFVDIDERSFNIDPERVQEAVTPKTKAVIAVHFGGAICDVASLDETCRQHGLLFLEDAAHAQGSELRGKRAGSFGVASSFSFQNGKVLTSGEGGMLLTSDSGLAESLRSFVNCGRVPGRSFYEHVHAGSNLRMTGFQAAVLLAQLEQLPQQIARRTESAQRLRKELGEVVAWQREPEGTTQNSFYLLTGRVANQQERDQLCAALTERGVPITPFYPHTLYQNEFFAKAECRVMACPVAERCISDAFWLPHRVLLAAPDVVEEVAVLMREALTTSRQACVRRQS